MAKIAILLSGFVRDHQLQSLSEKVIRPNVAAGNEVDVYVSTWDTRGTVSSVDAGDTVFTGREYWTGDFRTYDNDPIDKDALEAEVRRITPGQVHVRYQRYSDRARTWLTDVPAEGADERGKDSHTVLRIRGMWFGIDDVFSMVRRPRSYDFIVRTRFDIVFDEPVVVSRPRQGLRRRSLVAVGDRTYDLATREPDSEHIARIRSRATTTPEPRSAMLVPERPNGYIDDWFAVGTPETMSRHMTVFQRLDGYLQLMREWPEPFESESITVLNALQGGVGLVRFPKTIHQ
jgi:hypothetical protein